MSEERTGGIEELEAAVDAAEVAVRQAEEALRRAKHERWLAMVDEATARARRLVEESGDMPATAFAEKVADAARDHGAESAAVGRVATTGSWKRFRVLLAELTRRAESGEESLRALATANVRSDMDVAILVREVICEAIHRRRADWDPEHPVGALGLRNIPLDLVLSEFWDTTPGRLDQLAKMDLRGYASVVLDRALAEVKEREVDQRDSQG